VPTISSLYQSILDAKLCTTLTCRSPASPIPGRPPCYRTSRQFSQPMKPHAMWQTCSSSTRRLFPVPGRAGAEEERAAAHRCLCHLRLGSPAGDRRRCGWQNDAELDRIKDDRFSHYRLTRHTVTPRKQVRRITYLPQEQLVALVRGARALVFPSLYEGFGLPVLEAMMLGTPVMTSDVRLSRR